LSGGGYIVRMLARFLVLLMAVAVFGLAGCKSDFSPSFEAFSRNKLAVLARNMESTRDAQTAASDQVTAAAQTIRREAWTGADPAQSYDLARRLDSVCESRVRSAHSRLKVLRTNGEDFFRQWSKELAEYEDKDLRESSQQNRLKVKAKFDAAIDQMKKADAATAPALTALQDQVLFLNHHRNVPTVPERPPNSRDPSGPAELLAEQTAVGARLATEFVESVKSSPK
jgi:hypothetical protein